MEKELLEIKADMGSIKAEIRHLSGNVAQVQELLKSVTVVMEKQHTLGERVLKLKDNYEKLRMRTRALEDWKIAIVAGSSIVGALASFIFSKIF